MEYNVRVMEPEALMEQLPEMLLEAESIPLIISGNSMAPFLRHGRDTVYLAQITQPPKKGDMILFRRENGAYVLHRVYRKRNGVFSMVGDGQLSLEPGIRYEQMLAVVKAVRRNGRLLHAGSLCWEFFEHVWLDLLPLRPGISRLHRYLTMRRKRK